MNRLKTKNTTSSIYKGVDRKNNKWRARIKKDYKEIHLGLFENEKDAAIIYNLKA